MPGRSMRSNAWPAQLQLALLRLDGDAGVVADALVHAGQGVEQRGLAGVGVADECDGGSANGDHVKIRRLRFLLVAEIARLPFLATLAAGSLATSATSTDRLRL